MTLKQRPIIIGIVGDSAAGKTTLAAGITRILGPERTVNICIDDYHRYSRAQRATVGLTPLHPDCNHIDILEQHISLLRDGQPILKPVYDHNGGVLGAPEYVEPREFIILEGLLGFATPGLREVFDLKFFLDPPEPLRLSWKFQRDTGMRAYTMEQVMASLDRFKRDSQQFVQPQRAIADMVVSFYPPDDSPEETGAALNVRHILRPTLPRVDLMPVLEAGSESGVVLELARDVDGRPADALHIFGDVEREKSAAMVDIMWGLLDGKVSDHPPLGAFVDANKKVRYSAPLALSQLLITHYLLTRANDVL